MIRFILTALLAIPLPGRAATGPNAKNHPVKSAPARPKAAKRAPAEKPLFLPGPPITVVYPPAGWVMESGSKEFVYGAVGNPKARFSINGFPIKPHPLGGYLTYLPVSPGTFTFHCELELPEGTTTYDRTIYVTPPSEPLPPGPPQIDPASIRPSENLELRAGDWLLVRMKATPGVEAEFQAEGMRKRLPMANVNPALGLYEGAYQVQPGDRLDPAPVRFFAKNAAGSRTSADSKATVAFRADSPETAAVSAPGSHLKAGPDDSYLFFPPVGTKFSILGRQGPLVKARLSSDLSGWIPSEKLQMLPAGSPPPRSTLGTIFTTSGPDQTSVHLGMTDTIPYRIDSASELNRLTAHLYDTAAHTNWIVYESTDSFVRLIRWRQEKDDEAAVTVELAPGQRFWGYHASWENGTLVLEIRRPPKISARNPLQGRTVIVDPGHMPSRPGATGPHGLTEMDVNLAIAKDLAAALKEDGAKPVLTRQENVELGLPERAQIAWENRGDIFVSIHNNMLPDAANPFAGAHGFSIFYYQPYSLDLSRAVHRAYLRRIPLYDENMRFGDLLVARITEMPSVLTESAYMAYPEQEALLASPAFRKKLARAIRDGIADFFSAESARQQKASAAAGGRQTP